jgi:hypothetical protein
MTGAVTTGSIVEQSQPLAEGHNRRQADALLRPRAILTIKYNGLILRIPLVQILAPVNPDGIGVFSTVDADVVGEQEPGLMLFS